MDNNRPNAPFPNAANPEVFLARQPIFDRSRNVYAYEVLFRSSAEARAVISDGFQATSQMLLNAFVNFGLEQVVGEQLAFVNLTREFLVGDLELPLAKDRLVLEILEDIEPDDELIRGVRRLVDKGYTLALDDVTFDERLVPLLSLAKIVKVELPKVPKPEWGSQLRHFRQYNVQILAEKIETPADYELCHDLGFDLFQGYYFAKPQLMVGKRLTTNQAGVLELLAELNRSDVTVNGLERVLKRDAGLSFKLLRFINSANFGLRHRIESLRQAIVLLGLQGVRTIATLISVSQLSSERPESLRLGDFDLPR